MFDVLSYQYFLGKNNSAQMRIVPDVVRLNEGSPPDCVVFSRHHVNLSGAFFTSPAFCLLQAIATVGIADIGPQ
jgi:hypothetical protein